jgi:potassium large conductance calcium-activated channel subfamily M alpha protein 1
MELIITQFFGADFIYSFFAAAGKLSFLINPWTIVDFLTIIPVYVALSLQGKKSFNLSIFRFVRILRLVRILRVFKVLGGLSGVKRQVITLCLTLLSLVFMAAGIVQLMENDVKQLTSLECVYINSYTNWIPSCTPDAPAADNCDCLENNCESYYDSYDEEGQPSGVRCLLLTYYDAFYFMIVTIATVGYGDILPRTIPSKAVVMVYILTALVLIPMQVNKLTTLLSLTSLYRNPYDPSLADNHVIICGKFDLV